MKFYFTSGLREDAGRDGVRKEGTHSYTNVLKSTQKNIYSMDCLLTETPNTSGLIKDKTFIIMPVCWLSLNASIQF